MASLKEIFNNIKTKAETIFYDPNDMNEGYGFNQDVQQDPYQQTYHEQAEYQQGYQQPQMQYQQPAYQQNAYQQQPVQQYQQQNAYQQPMQQTYQQPQQYQQPVFQQGAYQQPQMQQYQQEMPVQEEAKVVPFPNAHEPQQENQVTACVVNARNVSECYSAIVQLRMGNMVVVVLENITDNMELRHYVDMLSGACYALKATITKLSRHGAYLIAPNSVRVCVDAATNQFNSPASRVQRPNTAFQQMGQQQAAPQQPQMAQPQQNPYMQQNAAYQRPVRMNETEQMPMYARPVSPDPRMAPQQGRMTFNGHVPDMPMDNAQ